MPPSMFRSKRKRQKNKNVMSESISNAAAGNNPQTEENRELKEERVKPKRKPKNWEEGFTMIENEIFTQGRFLSADAKVAYITLKSFQNAETGLCFPAYDKIIERSGLTRPRLADALEELTQFNWLTKKKRFSGSTYYKFETPLVYQLDGNKNRIGLFHDQTCPSKAEAEQWKKRLRIKNRRNGKVWSETVRAEGKRIADKENGYESEIPF